MKFKCKKEILTQGLSFVSKNVAVKTTMPILEGVLIETIDKKIKLTTNDLEIGTEYILDANVETSGNTVVDLKTFNEIIRKIESEEIEFNLDNNIFVIKSTSGIFKLQTMNPEEYTRLPVFNIEQEIILSQKKFKEMVRKTVFATSLDNNRPVYTGSLIVVENNILTIVAIDGFRMAVEKILLETDTNNFRAIIPAKALTEIIKTMSDNEEDTVKIGINKNQALFKMGDLTVVTRIIQGDYINYNNIIPQDFETKVNISKKNMLETLERVSIFAKEISEKDKKVPVKVKIDIDNLEISCVSITGDAKEKIVAEIEGKQNEIGFNPRYLIEALRVIDDEKIILEFSSSIAPLIIKPVSGNEYIYMVLPVKLKED